MCLGGEAGGRDRATDETSITGWRKTKEKDAGPIFATLLIFRVTGCSEVGGKCAVWPLWFGPS